MDRDPASVLDIVLACRRLKGFVAGRSREDLDRDELLQYAALHATALIGEAANRLSAEFRQAHPEIPWGDIIGTRNRIIHGYDQGQARRRLGHRDREGRAPARTIGTLAAPAAGVKHLMARKKAPPRPRSSRSATRTSGRTSRPKSCATSSPTMSKRPRRCSTPATRRSTLSSSGRARTSNGLEGHADSGSTGDDRRE